MTEPVSVREAIEHLCDARAPEAGENCALDACLGRVLHQPVHARATLPPSDVSAMDGYAVRLADTRQAGAKLTVIAEAPAGRPSHHTVSPMQAVRIFTGGALPEGADHILIQEHAERLGDQIRVVADQPRARHIRKMGLDFAAGDLLLAAGTRLGPAELAIAAAANHAGLAVRKRPKVALIASGSELHPPGSPLGSFGIANSNTIAISSLVRFWGGEPIDAGLAPDSIDAICKRVESAADCDVIVAIGGASVGDHDLMRSAFRASGAEMVFERVAVKPGKPAWHARLGKVPVLGLPGNPATAYVCAHLFLAPMLVARGDAERVVQARLSHDLPANGPRETYIRAYMTNQPDGRTVRVISQQDTALLHPFLGANCLVRRMQGDTAHARGDHADCLMLAALPG